MIMISVVIPLYNKQTYIAEAINSVLTQSFRDFELIIIDDGSTDGSLSIVEAFNEERIQLIKQVHSGVSEARNTGIKKAKYPWIALLDADDWWAPHFLNEIVGAMQKFPDQLIFASGRSRVFDTVTERYSNTLLPDDGVTELLNYFQKPALGIITHTMIFQLLSLMMRLIIILLILNPAKILLMIKMKRSYIKYKKMKIGRQLQKISIKV